jgi:hypothetical protein
VCQPPLSAVPDGTWFHCRESYPGLAPWAAFCRRFAAGFGELNAALKRRSSTVVSAFVTARRSCALRPEVVSAPLRRQQRSPLLAKDARNGAPRSPVEVTIKVNVKGNGQECLFHTGQGRRQHQRQRLTSRRRSLPPLRQAQGRLLRKERARMGHPRGFWDRKSKSKSRSDSASQAADSSVRSTWAAITPKVNSRFLRSAVPFGFAQGPAPVGMTRVGAASAVPFSTGVGCSVVTWFRKGKGLVYN